LVTESAWAAARTAGAGPEGASGSFVTLLTVLAVVIQYPLTTVGQRTTQRASHSHHQQHCERPRVPHERTGSFCPAAWAKQPPNASCRQAWCLSPAAHHTFSWSAADRLRAATAARQGQLFSAAPRRVRLAPPKVGSGGGAANKRDHFGVRWPEARLDLSRAVGLRARGSSAELFVRCQAGGQARNW